MALALACGKMLWFVIGNMFGFWEDTELRLRIEASIWAWPSFYVLGLAEEHLFYK